MDSLPFNQLPVGLGGDDALDPLADLSSFNILQFMQEDTPVDSPAVDQDLFMHAARPQQQRQQHHVADPHHNVVYQNTARLPDSPPITDISGAASSGSPSSNSDTPYSPDSYGNFGVHGLNNQGLILGVQELTNGMMLHPDHMQQGHQQRPAQLQQQQHILSPSPNTPMMNFMSPYNGQTPSQVSPQNLRNSEFVMGPGFGGVDLFNIIGGSSDGSLNSCGSESTNSRKRPRMDNVDNKIFNNNAVSDPNMVYDENFSGHQPAIKFSKFEEEKWHPMYDEHQNQLQQLQVCVVADKGFNYFPADNCFVNQKKNHFQISVHIEAIDAYAPKYVKKNGMLYPIDEFKLSFCGVKQEMPTSEIQIKQSQTDRKPGPHAPVTLTIEARKMTKVTVPRLHFQETTLNNQRKNGRANPDQKYFLLVVRLMATSDDGQEHLVQAYHSDKVIVRATNPGAFDPAEDIQWHRNLNGLYTHGPVSINCDVPMKDAKLSVNGDIYHVGRMVHPSDIRLKENIVDLDPFDALENIRKLHIVKYMYKPEIAEKWGLSEDSRRKTGLLAQELQNIMPDAVHDIGDYLTVDENRIFYETILATQELCRLTGDLDSKIDEKVDEIAQRLARYARRKKLHASMASNLSGDTYGDSKSVLSYSRSSLASSYVPRKERRERSQRCRSNCHRQEPLCNSKLTQGTIITLVIVMAFCLLSMTALYVLDWHNRTYGSHYPPADPIPAPGREGPPGKLVVPQKLPIDQPDAPAVISTCKSKNCHSYCCADKASMYTTTLKARPVDSMEDTKTGEGQKLAVWRAPDVINGIGKPLSPGVTIRIPEFNMTLDSRYCIGDSCSHKMKSYDLYVPISPYLPTIPLRVQINVPGGKFASSCGYLSEYVNRQCPMDTHSSKSSYPTVVNVGENTYELSAGTFLVSAYRFRVGFTGDTCSEYENFQYGNRLYEEYNIYFYRTCAPVSSSLPEPMGPK